VLNPTASVKPAPIRIGDVDQNLAGKVTGGGNRSGVRRVGRRQHHDVGILRRVANTGQSRLALDFANLGTGILDIADSETNGVTEFRPAPPQRAADRARTNDCDFHE
jgi:hypothetical protein